MAVLDYHIPDRSVHGGKHASLLPAVLIVTLMDGAAICLIGCIQWGILNQWQGWGRELLLDLALVLSLLVCPTAYLILLSIQWKRKTRI